MVVITFFIRWWTYSGLLNGHVSSQWLAKSTITIRKGVPKGVRDATKSAEIFVGPPAASQGRVESELEGREKDGEVEQVDPPGLRRDIGHVRCIDHSLEVT